MKKEFTDFQIKNRKAKHEYIFVELYQAGMLLTSSEIKSIRQGHVNINDAYCVLMGGELFIKNMHISEYKQATHHNHEPLRTRKLLVTRKELRKLDRKVREKNFTMVPYRIFFSETGYAKIEIALARGKKSFDKRETIKRKDLQRDLDRMKKVSR